MILRTSVRQTEVDCSDLASVDSTNGTSSRRNLLLLNDLQLLPGGQFKIYVDMCGSILFCEDK